MEALARVAKALTAAASAASAAAVTATQDGTVTQLEWLTILGAGLVAGWAVYAVRNRPPVPVPPAGLVVDEHDVVDADGG